MHVCMRIHVLDNVCVCMCEICSVCVLKCVCVCVCVCACVCSACGHALAVAPKGLIAWACLLSKNAAFLKTLEVRCLATT